MGACDGCAKMVQGKVRRLETGGGSGIFLCNKCLKKEIAWRKQRNKDLSPKARYRTKYKF